MTYEEQEQKTRDMLDECYPVIEIAGLSFSPSQIIEECDPIAFRCMVADMELEDEEDEENDDNVA